MWLVVAHWATKGEETQTTKRRKRGSEVARVLAECRSGRSGWLVEFGHHFNIDPSVVGNSRICQAHATLLHLAPSTKK